VEVGGKSGGSRGILGGTVIVRFGAFTLDAAQRRLSRQGADVHLSPKTFDLLVVLAGEAPRVVSKIELHERLWPSTFVSDTTLSGLVKELRRALDDRNSPRRLIRTAYRVGYALDVPNGSGLRQIASVSHWILVNGRRLRLQDGENLIGRDAASHVCLDESSVSRRHARIIVGRDGALLEDCGSKNGTCLDGVFLRGTVALKNGEHIAFGTVTAIYRSRRASDSTKTCPIAPMPAAESPSGPRKS
jgi:DNA-binding winged helix-turn-helix (wHTH) protein